MRLHMAGKLAFAALLVVFVAGLVAAQTAPPASTAAASVQPAAPAAVPAAAVEAVPARSSVKGVLTGNGVNIRKGPGTEYAQYFSAQLGYEVNVLSQQGEWYEIEFPIKASTYIARDYLQKTDDKAGIVTGNGVSVRGGPGTQYDRLYVVPVGHKFQVLGTDPKGDWYRVAPMPGETAWILSQYVRLSGSLPAGGAAAIPLVATGTTTTTTAVTTTTVAAVPSTTTAVATVTGPSIAPAVTTTVAPAVTEPAVVKPDPYVGKFIEAEKSFKAELDKENPAEWGIESIETAYGEILDKSTSAVTRDMARARLMQLKAYKSVQDRAKELGKIDEDLQARLKELEKQRAETITAIPEIIEAPFTATGVVEKFYITGIGGATHKLVQDGTILYLLKSDVVDLPASVGKRCGINGKITTAPRYTVRIIEVGSVKPLDEPQ